VRDDNGRRLSDHCHITTVELSKFASETVHNDRERWLKFFIEGERLDDRALPYWMQTREMQQAMNTLTEFSDKQHRYHAYQARLDYLRQQRSIEQELEEARQAEEAERQAKEAALAEVERLRALLDGHDAKS